MAKYSTGTGGGGGDGDSCELCGRETSNLRTSNVAGAELLVCSDCAPHGEQSGRTGDRSESRDDESSERNRKKRAAQNTARVYDASRSDSRHWEREGTSYESDRLPYLVSDYDERLERARQESGLTIEELAAELEVDEEDVLAVEQGRAARAGVGGSVVQKLQERLGVELIDE